MIWQVATVVDASPGQLRVAFDPLGACARCLRGDGCGAGVFARLFSRRQAVISLQIQHDFQVGQKLRVGVPGSQLLSGALFLYGLPVLAFVVGTLLMHALVGEGTVGDLAGLVAGVISAALVLLLCRRRPLHGLNPRLEPLSCTSSGCDG